MNCQFLGFDCPLSFQKYQQFKIPSNSGFTPSKARNSPQKQPFEFCSRQPEKGSSNALFYMNSHQRAHIFGRKYTFAADQIKRIPNIFKIPVDLTLECILVRRLWSRPAVEFCCTFSPSESWVINYRPAWC